MTRQNRKTNFPALNEYDWAELFAKLRDSSDLPHVANVRRILELLKSIKPGPEGLPGLRGRPGMHLFGELNRLVGEYQWHSIVHPSTEGVMEFLRPPFEVTGTKRWEYQAVRWLLDLFERRGELDMVHLCPMHEQRIECKGWFYGRPNKRFDRFCNPLCKQAHYDSTDEIKARRAKNAEHNRAYRSNLKRQEDAAKKKVGFKGAVLHRVSRAALSVKKAKPKASSD